MQLDVVLAPDSVIQGLKVSVDVPYDRLVVSRSPCS